MYFLSYRTDWLLFSTASTISYRSNWLRSSTNRSWSCWSPVCRMWTSRIWRPTPNITNIRPAPFRLDNWFKSKYLQFGQHTFLSHQHNIRSNGFGVHYAVSTKRNAPNFCSSSPARRRCRFRVSVRSRVWTARRSSRFIGTIGPPNGCHRRTLGECFVLYTFIYISLLIETEFLV